MIKQTLGLIRNYFYVFVGITYFGIYHFFYQNFIFDYIISFSYGELIFSYINAFFAFFTIYGLGSLFVIFINKIFVNISKRTDTELDNILFEFIIKFLNIIKYIISAYLFFYIAELPVYIETIIDKITSVLVIIVFLILSTQLINILFKKELILKSKMQSVSKALLPFINKVSVVFLWIVGIITIIGNLGYDVSALIAGAGIGGLAVALAAQKSLTNVFGAITILLNKPFNLGDFVNINGHIGVVKDIGLSYLTLQDQYGHQVMIPNENIISTSIENYSVRKNRRTDFSIGLVYGTSLEKMKRGVTIIEEILQEYVDKETISGFRVNFDMFGDFSLNINVTYFSLINSEYTAYLKQKEEINLEIKNRFSESDLDMAFPTQELILKKEA